MEQKKISIFSPDQYGRVYYIVLYMIIVSKVFNNAPKSAFVVLCNVFRLKSPRLSLQSTI